MIKLTWNKSYGESRLERVLIIIIIAIMLIYFVELVRTRIERLGDETINVEYQSNYEEISVCLNADELEMRSDVDFFVAPPNHWNEE